MTIEQMRGMRTDDVGSARILRRSPRIARRCGRGNGAFVDRRFEGRAALVTGGSNGLGRAIVAGLLEEGASVAILDLAPCEPPDGARVLMRVGDVGDPGVAASAVEEAVGRFGRLDILV